MAKVKSMSSKTKQDEHHYMYRCLNDKLGYCDGEPNFGSSGARVALKDGYGNPSGGSVLMGATCKSNPKTCRKYRTLSQMVAKAKED